jgi:hypothetical protein
MKAILVLVALLSPLCADAAEGAEYAIVSGVESFHRIPNVSNQYPWERAKADEIIVSNACGFAQVEYDRVTNPSFSSLKDDRNLKRWKALVLLGEWCGIKEFVLEGPTLVAYRTWKGKPYLLDYAELLVGDDGRLYVEDLRFIEKWGLVNLLRESPASDHVTERAAQNRERANGRIYIDAISMRANKSVERTRDR